MTSPGSRLTAHAEWNAEPQRLLLIQGGIGHSEPLSDRRSEVYELPRCGSWVDRRILLRAELSTPWGPLQMYSTHTARGEDCQVERVGEIVRGHESNGPTLLAGDFNMPERSTVLAGLKNKAGFLDAFRIANPTSDGPTVWQRITSPQPTVSRRVDFIRFLNGRKSTATVRSGRIVLDRPGTLPDGSVLWPSDHYGVLAELEIHPAVQPISLRPCAKNRFP